MGTTGFDITIKRTAEGDLGELWHAVKDRTLSMVWNVTSGRLAGFPRYLNSEDFRECMDGNPHRQSETGLRFAFWERGVEDVIVDYAIHLSTAVIGRHLDDYREIGKAHGFELALEELEGPRLGLFAKHGTSICRLERWRRKQPITDAAAFVTCSHRGGKTSGIDAKNFRASAMTGFCACPLCKFTNKAVLAGKIPEGWQVLAKDASALELAGQPADLVTWFKARGVKLLPVQAVALVARFAEAP